MSILLAILVVTFKSWCPYCSSAIMYLMSLFIVLLIVTHIFMFFMLTVILAPTYIRGMSLFTTEMTSVFSVLLPLSLLSFVVLDDSLSPVLVYPSPEVSLLDLGDFSSC